MQFSTSVRITKMAPTHLVALASLASTERALPRQTLALTGLEQNNKDQHQSRQQLQNRNSNLHNLSLQQNKAQRGYSS